ncbi:hypothetical protein PUR57_00730, partial [Streptomyces sp. JV176]|uniref:hypothetical protein n=1 Tax=Streptomyces sp. JV176 TaxID=858630 RepID=UPI002E75C7DC
MFEYERQATLTSAVRCPVSPNLEVCRLVAPPTGRGTETPAADGVCPGVRARAGGRRMEGEVSGDDQEQQDRRREERRQQAYPDE